MIKFRDYLEDVQIDLRALQENKIGIYVQSQTGSTPIFTKKYNKSQTLKDFIKDYKNIKENFGIEKIVVIDKNEKNYLSTDTKLEDLVDKGTNIIEFEETSTGTKGENRNTSLQLKFLIDKEVKISKPILTSKE